MVRKGTSARHTSGIWIDIVGVKPESRIGELSVGQFAQLLIQIEKQLRIQRLEIAKKRAVENMTELRSAWARPPTASAVEGLVRNTQKTIREMARKGRPPASIVQECQREILAKMPELLRKASPKAKKRVPRRSYSPARGQLMPSLRMSRYTILTSLHGERCLAYNSLSGATALLEAREVDILRRIGRGEPLDLTDGIVTTLLYGGFVTTGGDELEALRAEYNAQRYDASQMVLTIAPTLACNFGCDYCFQGHDKPSGSMSSEVQNSIIALLRSVAPTIKRLHVSWYGGEPLLKLDIIEHLWIV